MEVRIWPKWPTQYCWKVSRRKRRRKSIKYTWDVDSIILTYILCYISVFERYNQFVQTS